MRLACLGLRRVGLGLGHRLATQIGHRLAAAESDRTVAGDADPGAFAVKGFAVNGFAVNGLAVKGFAVNGLKPYESVVITWFRLTPSAEPSCSPEPDGEAPTHRASGP